MAQAMIDWFNSSPYGRKYPNAKKGRLNLSLGIMGHFGLDRYAKHKGAKEELKYIKTLSKAMRDNVNESPVSLNKAEMEKLHKDGEIEKDGQEIEFKEEKMNEGFATWEMRFSDMNLGGVKLSKKNVYRVKARNTIEAIKKAAKMAGVGKNWIATETHSLKKIG